MIQAVLFDLDGTLLDTAPDFEAVINHLLQEENLPPLASAEVRRMVSEGSRGLVLSAFGVNEESPRYGDLRQRLLDRYLAHLAVHTRPFPGIVELLAWLEERQMPWGIVTNKPSTYALPLMEQINLQPAPKAIVCPDHVSRAKPDPEPMFLACEQMRCQASRSLYIGDHRRDIEAGRGAGMATIAAAYGYIDESDPVDTWDADHIVHCASELKALLETLFESATAAQ